MNWGLRIAILTGGFVLFMTFLVIKAVRQNFDLVTEDYYGKELQYQKQIDKRNNHQKFEDGILITSSNELVVLDFPSDLDGKIVTGEILFFRPSDEKKDKRIKLDLQNGKQAISRSLLQNGFYRIQIDYKAEGKEFYFEDSIHL